MNLKHLIVLLFCISACSTAELDLPEVVTAKSTPSAVVIEEEKVIEEIPNEEVEIELEVKTEAEKEKTVKVKNEQKKFKTVILSWKAPKEKLLRYFIEYGYQKNKLNNKKTIEIANLQKIEHPKHGTIYIYAIENTPTNKTVFYRLQSENEIGVSKKSIILRVP